jgi:hypothetical protein
MIFWSAALGGFMELFIHNANIGHFQRLLAESKSEPSRDEDRHNTLLTLLEREKAAQRLATNRG